MSENDRVGDATAERRKCQRDAMRRHRASNPPTEAQREVARVKARERYNANRALFSARSRAYYRAHADKARASAKRWREKNRERSRELSRDWRRKNLEKHRIACLHQAYRTRYGTTPEAVARMREAQGDKCAICGNAPRGRKNHSRLCVDHDHVTGRVRSLLCVPCNAGLGNFKESLSILDAAMAYLRSHGESEGSRTTDREPPA